MKRFHHKFTLPLILTFLVIAVGALIIGFFNYHRQTTLPSDSDTTAIGVELDQNLADIDLHKLQSNGISFIYLRGTQGRSYFDNDYLLYRDQVQGTKLAYGTILTYSSESTPEQQFAYFMQKVGRQTGSLPILLEPAESSYGKSDFKKMAVLASLLQNQGKRVMVEANYRYHNLFMPNTKFLSTGGKEPNAFHYAFWLYTNNGRVKNVSGLEKGVTMFSYNGTVAQYRQNYGQLTQ